MVYDPTALTVKELILNDLEAALAAMAPPSYSAAFAKVYRWNGTQLDITSWPACVVHPGEQTNALGPTATPNGTVDHDLPITLFLGVRTKDWSTALERLLADVRVVIHANHRWSERAKDTVILNELVYESDATEPIAGAQMSLRVSYRTLYDDPGAAI